MVTKPEMYLGETVKLSYSCLIQKSCFLLFLTASFFFFSGCVHKNISEYIRLAWNTNTLGHRPRDPTNQIRIKRYKLMGKTTR